MSLEQLHLPGGNIGRVCIVSPGAIGSNPRVVKEADALHSAGFDVTVISTRTLDRVDQRDAALMQRVKWRIRRIDLRSRYAWRLRRLLQIAARIGWSATGWSALAGLGFTPYTLALRGTALATSADLYVAHYPAALPVVAAAALKHGARYAYDAEDYHLGDWPEESAFETERRLVRAIEGRYLPGCAYVTAASPGIADAYVEAYGIERPSVVLHDFPLSHAPTMPTPCGTQLPGPSVYWFSQTIGAGRGLETASAALALAKSRPDLFLRGTPAQGYEEKLRTLASEHGVSDRLHFLPPAPPDEMERLGVVYDLGYVGEVAETHNRQIAMTNKLFSYLTGGVAILASDIPAHLALAPELGSAITIFAQNDISSLARAMDHILLDRGRLASARAAAWSLGQGRFSWDVEQKVFLACVADAPAGASVRPSELGVTP